MAADEATDAIELIRLPGVQRKVPYSRVQIWRMEKANKFPKRIVLGPNSCAWLRHEIDAWITERAAQR